jgi:hypothetical protein
MLLCINMAALSITATPETTPSVVSTVMLLHLQGMGTQPETHAILQQGR